MDLLHLNINVPINLHSHVGVIYLVILIAMSAEASYRIRRDPLAAIFLKNCDGSCKFRNVRMYSISTPDEENSVKMSLGSLKLTGQIGLCFCYKLRK